MGRKTKEEPLSERIVHYLLTAETESYAHLNAANLANMFHLDQAYLTVQFQEDRHVPLDFFISRMKMSRAFFVLSNKKNNKLSITAISKKLGFASRQHFIDSFQKHFGINPYKFREAIRRTNNKWQ